MREGEKSAQLDWVGNVRSYTIAWGIPTAALIAGVFTAPPGRTVVWSTALVWMGTACIVNALRCGRLHCYLTGPFFLLMAVLTALHGLEILWLGANGWSWLGLTLVFVGGGLLWYVPERMWGKYVRRQNHLTGTNLHSEGSSSE
jgi:hypothetical protein